MFTKYGGTDHPGSDYINGGPKIKETLQIIRRTVETRNAFALMGNHEYNALCFHYQESEGGYLPKHLIKNVIQHIKTLEQFQNQQEFLALQKWDTWSHIDLMAKKNLTTANSFLYKRMCVRYQHEFRCYHLLAEMVLS
jgi:predicted MPP superfamily phosphohydrolase